MEYRRGATYRQNSAPGRAKTVTVGLPLSIQDISNFIRDNAKFINQPQIGTFGFGSGSDVDAGTDINRKPQTSAFDTMIGEITGGMGTSKEIRLDRLQHNVQYSDIKNLGTNLDTIFGMYDLKRLAVLSEVGCPANKDVSFVSALLNATVNNYDTYDSKIKIDLTEKLIRKCLKEYKTSYENFGYNSLGWKTKDLRKTISNFLMNKELLRCFADALYINIFVLDISTDRLLYVGTDPCVKYKKNVLLLKFGERFELVFEEIRTNDKTSKQTKTWSSARRYVFDHTSGIIKKFVNSTYIVEKLDCNYNNSKDDTRFVVGDEVLTDIAVNKTAEVAELDESAELAESADSQSHADSDIKFEEGDADDDEDKNIIGITEAAEFSDSDSESDSGSDSDSDSGSTKVIKTKTASPKTDTPKATQSMSRDELSVMAKKLGVDIYYRDDQGRRKPKTKQQLIDSINE